MSKLALLDGDGFLYRIAASMEKVVHGVSWVSPHSLVTFGEFQNYRTARQCAEERSGKLWQRKEIGTLEEAKARLRAVVNETLVTLGCGEMGFIVSGVRNFRDQIGTIRKYKGNRDATARPALLGELREWACGEYTGFVETDNMEADDFISILVNTDENPSNIVIVSNDKDLRQIPGYHYNWVTKEREYINPMFAKELLYKQILMGDPGDNVVGCWGVGPKKAAERAAEWIEGGWSDAMIWSDMICMFEESKTKPNCPYLHMEAEDVAEETYKLIHLLEYGSEADDILLDIYNTKRERLCKAEKNKKNAERTRKTNGSNQDTKESPCAPSAAETDKKESGQSAISATG